MPTSNNPIQSSSLIRDTLKKHNVLFDAVDSTTIRLHSNLGMLPIITISNDDVAYNYPLAYYETEGQRRGLLGLFEHTRNLQNNDGWELVALDSNMQETRAKGLPSDVIFKDSIDSKLLSAFISFKLDYINDRPEELLSVISSISSYSKAVRSQICETVYTGMTKLVTDPADPKSFFFCMLLLSYRIHCSISHVPLRALDWTDVIHSIRRSRQVVFYPSLSADSFDGLMGEMKRMINNDRTTNEPYGIIATLTLPEQCLEESFNSQLEPQNLCNRLASVFAMTHIYIADNNHPYTAETALLILQK